MSKPKMNETEVENLIEHVMAWERSRPSPQAFTPEQRAAIWAAATASVLAVPAASSRGPRRFPGVAILAGLAAGLALAVGIAYFAQPTPQLEMNGQRLPPSMSLGSGTMAAGAARVQLSVTSPKNGYLVLVTLDSAGRLTPRLTTRSLDSEELIVRADIPKVLKPQSITDEIFLCVIISQPLPQEKLKQLFSENEHFSEVDSARTALQRRLEEIGYTPITSVVTWPQNQ